MKKELWFVTGWYSTPLFAALAKALQSEFDPKFIAHDSYSHQYLLAMDLPVFKRSQNKGAEEPDDFVLSQMDAVFTAQGFGDLGRWEKYFAKRTAGYRTWLTNLWEAHSPDAVVIWNSMWHYEKVAESLAIDMGVKTVFLENGYFPETAHIDPEGVNARAEIIRIPSENLAREVAGEELDQFMQTVRDSFTELRRYTQADDLSQTLSFPRKVLTGLEILFSDLPYIGAEFLSKLLIMHKAKRRSVLLQSDGALPERYIFLPLQVSADSQLVLNSPWIKSPAQVIELVAKTLQENDLDMTLVVKEHPMEDPLVSFDETAQKYPSIYWASTGSLQELIQGAEAVVNINSSVGFQALLFGKPVICLGTALYARAGLAVSCSTEDELCSAFNDVLSISPNLQLVKRFAFHLHQNYCASYHRGGFSAEDVRSISASIRQLFC